MDPLRYIFCQPMPIEKLAKWQISLSEFDIVYIAQKVVKGQALDDLLAESPVDEELKPLDTHFLDGEVLAIEEEAVEPYTGWKLFFDGAVNYKGSGIEAVLILENGQHYPMTAKLKFCCTNNMAKHEACILGLKMAMDMEINEFLVTGDSDLLTHQVQGEWATKNKKILLYVNLAQRLCKKFRKIEFRHTPKAQNEFTDALATIASMIQHPESSHIDPIRISLKEEHAHCCHIEAEPDGKPLYNDIQIYLEKREYPKGVMTGQKEDHQKNGPRMLEDDPFSNSASCAGNGSPKKVMTAVEIRANCLNAIRAKYSSHKGYKGI
ncbi:uncharacterized protein LOC132601618 [Lycium barbarum]|uniref:uncharacterized protein LOC132601618 n=1 Tax=Lycium barbarum TaxID=112863 RepID=UPI00293EBB28|nr:uncharacterized protein LOC132601618 [Lycium barbarum]